jgi:hypothetical protein
VPGGELAVFFSGGSKLFIAPSIPLQFTWNGRVISVTSLSVYHPFPIRIENVQYDAVLSLNDPSVGGTDVVLIPLTASSISSPSAVFMDRIGPHISRMLTPDPTTKQFAPVSAATGADWSLNNMLPTRGNRIQSGFYQWFSSSRYVVGSDPSNFLKIIGAWVADGPRTNYIVVDTPATISPAVLSSILMLPRTEPSKAISAPFRKGGVTYTPCASTPETSGPVRESFTPDCDPFGPNAYRDTRAEKDELMKKIVSAIFSVLGVMIAVVLGLILAGSAMSIYTKEFGETAGGWIYKQIQSVKGGVGDLKGNILESIASKVLKA